MSLALKDAVFELTENLRNSGKTRLSECIEQNWEKSAVSYSRDLNTYQPHRPMEPEMLRAFELELERLDTSDTERSTILKSLNKRRVLQTAPHLGATESPRMLCINWLGSLGVPEDGYYVVGMFSGIPFSNNSRPGRIIMKTNGVNLFPSTMQDGLVYRSLIPEKLLEVTASLPEEMKKYLPETTVGESYTKWALITCQQIERTVLRKNNLVYVDINEVVTNYLIQVLQNPGHVIYKILFDSDTKREFVDIFPNEILFYMPVMMSKFETTRKVKMVDLSDPATLIENLQTKRYCPALLIGFLSIAFINQFKCFGSFRQVEYLPTYQAKLAMMSCLQEFEIDKASTDNLTTGNWADETIPGLNPFPADIIMGSEAFAPNPEILFGELVINMQKTLLDN